jgi:transcriptional regulator with XRE-family HTH domain
MVKDADDRRLLARRSLGGQVRDARRAAGLTQAGLSSLSGLGINTITRCERGSMAVTVDTLDRLAEVLGRDFVIHASPAGTERTGTIQPTADTPEGYDLDDDA